MTTRVILFVFAGRRPNMELQMPFVHRILEEDPYVEFHVWNLARDNGDSKYLQTLENERITVWNDYRRFSPGYEMVYRHYSDEQFKDAVFVKLDDDVVFLQTTRFRQFVRAIKAHPEAILSANIINNGACTPLEPSLWDRFKQIGIPLLDVHKSTGYAGVAHNYFFDHYEELLTHDVELIPTDDWLSINAIGYTWETNNKFAELVGTRCEPRDVAGRTLGWLGDEGVANTLPRIIMRGFLACHLTFGPQNLTTSQLFPWRQRYAQIGDSYLATARREPLGKLPELSSPSYGQGPSMMDRDWRQRWGVVEQQVTRENDPLCGRFKA